MDVSKDNNNDDGPQPSPPTSSSDGASGGGGTDNKKKKRKRKRSSRRCTSCRARLTTMRFACSGCGLEPLCLSCTTPERHACGFDWKAAHRDRLRRDNAEVRPTTLRDTI